MPYSIEITDAAFDELQSIESFYCRQIVDAIDKQLIHQPTVETRNRKILVGLQPDFEHGEPVWELRVGAYRIYYHVDETAQTVVVRAIREKPPHATTEQVT
jgi:mRNA-degrading endonuclease RelE of RelBE toxin-antitoxin system